MKSFPLATLLLSALAVPFLIAQEPATYLDQAKVAELFTKGGRIGAGSDYAVSASRRTAPGQVEVHEKETDIFLVTEGTAVFITGGKMIGGKLTKAGQWLGTDIEGGVTHQLKKGDFITVPAGTPHWFKEVPAPGMTSYLVKVIKP
jgi:mannose-6-phosphate isomerase-like protein (cupin superfamily)